MISRMIWNCHFLKLNCKSNTLYLYRYGRLHKSLLKQLLYCMLMKQKIRTKLDKVLGVVKTRLLVAVLLTYCVDCDVLTKGIKMCESDSLRIRSIITVNKLFRIYK